MHYYVQYERETTAVKTKYFWLKIANSELAAIRKKKKGNQLRFVKKNVQ